jgi:rhodanese-related sulfurtransferase
MDFLQNNILLIAVAFVSGAMLIWPLVRRTSGGPWVNTVEATQLINRQDALVIDVRAAEEYAKGHILGAKNLPLADLERRAAELDKHKAKPLIVHCENGNRSTSALPLLRKQGFASVVNLTGGYAAWQQAGLPVEK